MCVHIHQLPDGARNPDVPGVGRMSGVGDIHRQILQLLGNHMVSTSQNFTGHIKTFCQMFFFKKVYF